jgi:hypothetical protein
MKQGAQLFAYLKQLLKLYTRKRDKAMMLSVIEEVNSNSFAYKASILRVSVGDASTLPRPLHDLL